jgi:guanyl-specific ribonuclease Sa
VPQKSLDTLEFIDNMGHAPSGFKGGGAWANDGRGGTQQLPVLDSKMNPITYQEWDVNPLQAGVNRGPERLITGSDGSAYFTGDHYSTFTNLR